MIRWFLLYLLVFCGALGLSAVLCAAARALGRRWGLMDQPAGRKAHERPIALTGGWAIYATFVILVAGGAMLSGPLAASLPPFFEPLRRYLLNIAEIHGKLLAVLGGTTLMFVTGVVDDLRPLSPRVKLTCQILATLPLLAVGIAIHGFLPAPLGWLLTALWVVGLTNSFNLLDNMDGLSASVALVICLVLALAALQGGQFWIPALFLCLAGTLGGYLCYNFHPATLFMGDAGSLTIGYLMAVFSIQITYYVPSEPTSLPVFMPLAIMGVPLFDTLSVMVIRWRAGRPLMLGDRNHFSHRLLALGLSVRQTALTIALLTGACGLLALPLRSLHLAAALIHMLGLALLFSVVIMLEMAGRIRK